MVEMTTFQGKLHDLTILKLETFVHEVEIHNSKAPRQAIASLDVGCHPAPRCAP